MKNYLLCIFCLAILPSCLVTYGDNNYSSITTVNTVDCDDKAERMYLFFEGEPIDYEYERIGLVEAKGNRYSSDELLMGYLKNEAWNACANAIINIKKDYQVREEGSILDDDDERDYYDATIISGLAVRIDTNFAFLEKYGGGLDTSFRQEVSNDMKQQANESDTQIVLSIVLGLVGLIVFVSVLGTQ